ncbi:MAG: diguanylate cyclase [Nitrospirae bacterium]|nr:diguanylate cyclase [Nitrospirota bacterium]
MTLRQRISISFIIVVAAVIALIVFSFKADYAALYGVMMVAALTAIAGLIIFSGVINRMLKLIEALNGFAQGTIQGTKDIRLDVQGSDELSRVAVNVSKMADTYKEKISDLEKEVSKRQRAVRELSILNELMGFVTSELKFEIVLKSFVDRAGDLLKSEYCAAVIFEAGTFATKYFITREGTPDHTSVQMNSEGIFKKPLNEMIPLRISSGRQERIKIPELNMEVRDVLSVPLIFSNMLYGLLLLADKKEGTYEQDDEDTLMDFAFQAFQIIGMHDKISNLAVTDGLTGLNNHRYFQEELTKTSEIAKRYGKHLSLLILDVDHFKSFNDSYGHQVGDMVLKSIARLMRDHVRKTDFAARYGGEEFAVIMPETGYNGARILAERLRTKIAENPFILPNGEKTLLTVSVGFAAIPEDTQDKTQLIALADKALYFAKENGRNRSHGYGD